MECVVQHRAIAGNVLTRTNPAIFIKVHIDQHVIVVQHACCWNFLRWNVNDQIRFAKCPLRSRPGKLGQGVCTAVARCARFYPMHKGLSLRVCQYHIVFE